MLDSLTHGLMFGRLRLVDTKSFHFYTNYGLKYTSVPLVFFILGRINDPVLHNHINTAGHDIKDSEYLSTRQRLQVAQTFYLSRRPIDLSATWKSVYYTE